jgi:hypothetical protein
LYTVVSIIFYTDEIVQALPKTNPGWYFHVDGQEAEVFTSCFGHDGFENVGVYVRGCELFCYRFYLCLTALEKKYKVGLKTAYTGYTFEMLCTDKSGTVDVTDLVEASRKSFLVHELCVADHIVEDDAVLWYFVS